MNINRNNYENFFLLYVDGELAPQEMLEVDAFCGKHPDLAEELQLLMETKLDIDTSFTFPEKAELLKMEPWDADNLSPLQSAMLSMLDGETVSDNLKEQLAHNNTLHKEWTLLQGTQLPAESHSMAHKHTLIKAQPWDELNLTEQQLQLLEALDNGSEIPAGVVGDPEMQKDWMLLQQSLLQPELVTMPGKQKLYRKAEDEKAPVIRLGWMGLVAAAAVMVGIGWVVFNSMSNTVEPPQQSGTQEIAQQPVVKTPMVNGVDTSLKTTPEPIVKEQPEVLYASATETDKPLKAGQVKLNTTTTNKQDAAVTAQEDQLAYEQRARLIAANRLSPEEVANPNRMNTNATLEPQTTIAPRNLQSNLATTVGNDGDNNATVQYAVLQETEEADEYVTIGGAKVNKQKLRNVFRTVTRKVTRSLDKSTVAPASELR